MSKVNNKDGVVLVSLILWRYFTPCSSVFIVNFEQVNAGWLDLSVLALDVVILCMIEIVI